MATTTVTRRLAAILPADVAGYSGLMGLDEEGTHERFKAHLREVVDPKIREHHGRIIKTTCDGVNVATRLEVLADPGGICISQTVRDHIRDKLPYPFEDRGEQSVKNIARRCGSTRWAGARGHATGVANMHSGPVLTLFWRALDALDYWVTLARLRAVDAMCGPLSDEDALGLGVVASR
jgi:class 3 adenylate cyclase